MRRARFGVGAGEGKFVRFAKGIARTAAAAVVITGRALSNRRRLRARGSKISGGEHARHGKGRARPHRLGGAAVGIIR